MANSSRPPTDDDIEKLMRSMRPHPAKTVLILATLLVTLVGGLFFIVDSAFTPIDSRSFEWSHRQSPNCPLPSETDPGLSQIDSDVQPHGPLLLVAIRQVVGVHTNRRNREGVHAFGTGFLIDEGLVVTAAHIFTSMPGSEKEPVHVLCGGENRLGTVQAFDWLRDTVLIAAPACHGQRLTFSRTEPEPNAQLHVSGFTFDDRQEMAYGFHRTTSLMVGAQPDTSRSDIEEELALRLIEMNDNRISPYLAVAGAFVPGNSGSPVLSERGDIVGMLVAADRRLNRSYAVRANVILDVLAAAGRYEP